jgi:hypothetical protein
MAGKHVGSAAYSDDLSHPPAYPGRLENRAWMEGVTGNPDSNPHTSGTPAATAYTAGSEANSYHEAAPGGSTE